MMACVTGRIYYLKGHGLLENPDGTSFDGDWDSTGDFTHGKLFDRRGQVLQKWRDGEEVDPSDDSDESSDDDEES